MPAEWAGFLAYSQPVERAWLQQEVGQWVVVGEVEAQDPEVWLAITTVPMGWSGAVGVAQAVVRQLVFGASNVDLATKVAKCKIFPTGPNYSLVYLDAFDFDEPEEWPACFDNIQEQKKKLAFSFFEN